MRVSLSAFSFKKNLVSKLFQPTNLLLKNQIKKKNDVLSKSQTLMLNLGIIKSQATGSFCILPLGERSLQKLIKIVDNELEQIGAQKLILPLLTDGELWKLTGRWHSAESELFTLTDRHDREYVLSPTNEEAITELLASISTLSYKNLPLRLYQISNKFRDEMKPRFGLIRGREFLMKDLYTFDSSYENAEITYEEVNKCYENIFKKIGIPILKVQASNGLMGGTKSHEYQYATNIGEDIIYICKSCNHAINKELMNNNNYDECIQCGNKDITVSPGIEVGHTFILGSKYSEPLKAHFQSNNGEFRPLQMGCFGLGMTRIIAAACEALSNEDGLRWPLSLAPFQICLIPPKKGSKEHTAGYEIIEQLYSVLNSSNYFNDIIIDDRINWTIGRRLLEARRVGYPYIVVAGHDIIKSPPEFELHQLNDEIISNMTFDSLVDKLNDLTKSNEEPHKLYAVE